MKLQKLLNNKNILYLIIALAVLCVLGYICVSSYECLAVFVVAYFICCNYIKNNILCIGIALFISNFLFGCTMSLKGKMFEGYSNPKLSPVFNTSIAGEIAAVAGEEARKETEKAVVNQGGSEATAKEAGEEAKEKVETKVVEKFRGGGSHPNPLPIFN
jgi:hypothetical protein